MTAAFRGTALLVESVFWRRVTRGDFFNIERAAGAGPQSGGGQLYIDLPLGGSVTLQDFGNFFFGKPLNADEGMWERRVISALSLSNPTLEGSIELTPRRGGNRRYMIANQNRQALGGSRHPAWSAEQGFPRAPSDVSSPRDHRISDISFLKIFIARADGNQFLAGFTNSSMMPESWPKRVGLEVLFRPNSHCKADGIIQIAADVAPNTVQLGGWVPAVPQEMGSVGIRQVGKIIRRSATQPRRRLSQKGIDSRAVRPDPANPARIQSPRASEAEDWIENLLRRRYSDRSVLRIGHTKYETIPREDGLLPGADFIIVDGGCVPERFAEVKSSTGPDPSSIRLTAAEFRRAKQCSDDGLPYDIWIVSFDDDLVSACPIPGFEQEAIDLTVDDLVSLEIGVELLDPTES